MDRIAEGLETLVGEMRRITAETGDPARIVHHLEPVVRETALAKAWVEREHYDCDAEQGFGVRLLHEEPDHSLAVLAVAWLPGRGVAPHNHGTWALVAGVDGPEKNVHWRRRDDGARAGYAEVEPVGEEIIGPGDVLTMLSPAIHGVANESDQVTLSLHVYGMHPNHTDRSQFDPEARAEQAFKFKQQERVEA